VAEEFPDSEAQKQVAFLLVAKHVMDRLQDGIVGPAPSKEGKEAEALMTRKGR
jgi:hypothetical protein